jgi:hypothetical protein
MEIALVAFHADRGWSAPLPALDGPQTLVVVFGASRYLDDPAPLLEARAALSQAQWIGCSTAGEIFGAKIYDDSLALAIVRFSAEKTTRLRGMIAPIAAATESFATGAAIGAALAGEGLRGVFVLSDGLKVNGTELVRGLSSGLPAEVVVTGGLAGDGDRFARTWVLGGDAAPRVDHVAAIAFYGDDVRIGHGFKGGWDAFGPRRTVTRSAGNVLFELDGRPALQLYKEYLGERASGLPATGLLFPLALSGEDAGRTIVRTILAIDEATDALIFAGDIPTGARAQLMKANFDRLIEGAEAAGEGARATLGLAGGEAPVGGVLTLAISCVGRRLVLGERCEEEVEATLEALPAGAQQIGFYSYGELSPHASGGCELHNQTMTLTTICEL